jgi:hypothetical protein
MMCAVAAVVFTLFAPQEDLAKKVEELTRRLEALERERTQLLEQIADLEQFGKEAAESISRLKKVIASGGARPAPGPNPGPAEGPAPAPANPKAAETGPTSPVQGKILTVVPEHGFMIVNLGEEDGVKEGWSFEVLRPHRDQDGALTNELLGKATFEKYVSSSRSQSKLKIVDGDPEKMKYGDSVVANRSFDKPLPAKPAPEKEAPAKDGQRSIKIAGVSGDSFFINAGAKDKLKQSDRVFVYRDKRAIAQLRLDQVGPDFAVGKIIDGTKTAEVKADDEVFLKDFKTAIVGKVKRIETSGAATGAWIEVGRVQGVKPAMQFEVRRNGKLVGRLVVKEGGPHHSVCEPVPPLMLEDLKTDDFVESVE